MMASSKSISGKWFGSFSYGHEDEIINPEERREDVTFSLDLTDNNGSITGTCIDDEIKDLIKGVITVTGFIEEDIISFTKQYPCFYFTDENGQIQFDHSQVHPPIVYSGVYDTESNSYSGDWEMTIYTENVQGECFDDILYGTWRISRSADTLPTL